MLPGLDFIGEPIIYVETFITLFMAIYTLFLFFEHRKYFSPSKPKTFPRVSIVIPVYNGAKYIGNCLKSVKKLNYPKEKLEIIVVDDGSTDNSYEEAIKFHGVKILKKKHSGKAASVNYGLKVAKGDLIGILDCDSVVEKDALRKMIEYFDKDNVAAVISGRRVKNPKGILEKFQEIEYLLTLFFWKNYSFVNGLFITPGVLSLYRKSILDKVGKFRDNITEDLEIALRLLSKDYTIKCALEASTYTVVPNRLKDLTNQRVRWNYGLLTNLKNYTSLFSRKYRELGVFILPFTILTHILLVVFFTYIIITFLFHWVNTIYLIYLTGWETYLINLLNYHFRFNLWKSEFFIFLVMTLIFAFTLMVYALSNLKVKRRPKTILKYVIYLVSAGYLYFYFWIMTFYKFLRKDIRW